MQCTQHKIVPAVRKEKNTVTYTFPPRYKRPEQTGSPGRRRADTALTWRRQREPPVYGQPQGEEQREAPYHKKTEDNEWIGQEETISSFISSLL